MKKTRTNFEQIPVEVVKKIAKDIDATKRDPSVTFESAAAKTAGYAIRTAATGCRRGRRREEG